MKVATLATSGPHVSAMMSSVRACVPISIPLLTKMNRGSLFASNVGLRASRVSLNTMLGQLMAYRIVPETYLTPCVGMANRNTSILRTSSADGNSGPTAVIASGNTWSFRNSGFRWFSLKCFTRLSERDHMKTSCAESPRWSAKQLPKLPAPKTRTLALCCGSLGDSGMTKLVDLTTRVA